MNPYIKTGLKNSLNIKYNGWIKSITQQVFKKNILKIVK